MSRASPTGRAGGLRPEPVAQSQPKALIPDAKPRDALDLSSFEWPFGAFAPGGYGMKCHGCGDTVMGVDKRAMLCLPCSMDSMRENYIAIERALRIHLWNSAKQRGLSDRAAMEEVKDGVAKALKAPIHTETHNDRSL